MPQKILFIINPGSGNQKADWETEINNYFKDKDYELDFYRLGKPPDCADVKKYIDNSDAQKIVAVGGDGTITMVAGFLAGTERPLGILPGGSANGMAKELMIPNKPQKAIDILINGIITPVDTILINKEYTCLHLSDIGVNAQLIKNFEEGNKRGMAGYAKVLFKTLTNKKRLNLTLCTNKEDVICNAIMVVLANAGRYGTGAVINPDGEIDDKMFEAVVKRLTPGTIGRMIFSGRFKPKNVETYQCRSLKITSKNNVHFQVDGEYLGKLKEVTAKIQPHNINLILPECYTEAKG